MKGTTANTKEAAAQSSEPKPDTASAQAGNAESKPDEQQALAILDRADVHGKERLDIMRDFRNGKYTLADLEAGYPAKNVFAELDAANDIDESTRIDILESGARRTKADDILVGILDRIPKRLPGEEYNPNWARVAYAVQVNPFASEETKARAKALYEEIIE